MLKIKHFTPHWLEKLNLLLAHNVRLKENQSRICKMILLEN